MMVNVDRAEDAGDDNACDAHALDSLAFSTNLRVIDIVDQVAIDLQSTINKTAIASDQVSKLRRPVDTWRYTLREWST